jgi:hypothetical protein
MSEHLTSTRIHVLPDMNARTIDSLQELLKWRCLVHTGPKRALFLAPRRTRLALFLRCLCRKHVGLLAGTHQGFDTVDMKIYAVLGMGHVLCTPGWASLPTADWLMPRYDMVVPSGRRPMVTKGGHPHKTPACHAETTGTIAVPRLLWWSPNRWKHDSSSRCF